MSNIKVRFAPSPTGWIHIGNVRTALFNYLWTKKMGGTMLLRIDDTDVVRSKKEYEDGIYDALNWLGIKWDEEERQSRRVKRYDEVVEKYGEDSETIYGTAYLNQAAMKEAVVDYLMSVVTIE